VGSQMVIGRLEEPSEDERTSALLAHLMMAFTGFVGPLVIFCVKQDSRFVKFHSLQALIWYAIYFALLFGGMLVLGVVVLFSVIHNPPPHSQGLALPFVFLFPFPALCLGFLDGWVVNLILRVVYAIKANWGEWAAYPVLGKWLLPARLPSAQ
jgi:uncharacterized Tic20 family protein